MSKVDVTETDKHKNVVCFQSLSLLERFVSESITTESPLKIPTLNNITAGHQVIKKNGDQASLVNPHSLQAYPQGTDLADNRFGSMEDTGQFCLALLLYNCAFPYSQLQNQP